MVRIIKRDRPGGKRETDLIHGFLPPPNTPGSHSCALYAPTPQLDMDTIDMSPFSESFSGWINDENHLVHALLTPPISSPSRREEPRIVSPNISYDIERFTNIRDINPHWDHQIDEIMVLSPRHKARLPTVNDTLNGSLRNKKRFDFERLRVVRTGATPGVTLCRRIDNNRLYAVKSVRLTPDARSESACLQMVSDLASPFLPTLHWSFEDLGCMYAVMDFYPGGDLAAYIARNGALHPDHAHFYACEMVEALGALHSAGIIHRDLKPENVTIDSTGHVVLADFGCAKVLQKIPGTQGRRSSTFYGAKEYQAPEMVLGWMHDFSVDCWGFGVVLFVMLFGTHPFTEYAELQDLSTLRNAIAHCPAVILPQGPIEIVARNLISECLERNPAVRYKVQDIKRHCYFAGVDWARVVAKNITVPWIPQFGSDVVDLRYFRRTNEKTLVSDGPSSADVTAALPIPPSIPVHHEVPEPEIVTEEMKRQSSEAISMVDSKIRPAPRAIKKRYSTLLDAIAEDKDEGYLRESYISADPLEGMALKDHLESQIREQVAKNRASFWDNLTDDGSSASTPGTSIELQSALRLSALYPHRLRKQKSFADRIFSTISTSAARPKARIKNKMQRRVRIVDSPVVVSPQEPSYVTPDLDLPSGIVQTGNGIGFTYTLAPAAISKASICTTTPRACHGISLKGFPRFSLPRIARRYGTQTLQLEETQEDREMMAVMREIYGSTWSLDMSNVGLSYPHGTFGRPACSAALDTPCLTPETPEFQNTKEAVAGDPDATLRLVSPSSIIPPPCD